MHLSEEKGLVSAFDNNGSAPLTVYKASAGSGKTFTLAVEYIKLLVSDPSCFKYILAVTFTNKATQEMKQRILSQLYGIANSLPDSDQYLQQIAPSFPSLSERVIRQRCADALTLLVHNYNLFRVETIDSFFQRVLRNLARELGLTANLQVALNDSEVESQAVDNIIENIEVDSDPLLNWIMDFVQERMADDKSWNVIGQIKDFGKNIFSDFYKDHQEQLRLIMNNPQFFTKYTSSLRALKAKANKTMADYAHQYDAIAASHGLVDDYYFHGHSNAPGYFEKLASGDYLGVKTKMPNSYIASGIDNPEKLVKKAYVGKREGDIIINEVAPLLAKAEEARKKAVVTVNSVDLTLQNINELRLLGRIEEEVRRINSANNDYPLSNTQKLLSSLIDKQDSPFIYEKIGGQLRYIMIDEFQDTSLTQWENFKVLLDDCISHQSGSLIVGDVKQSIYRWRNGDWRLLQSLSEDNYPDQLQVKHLDTNYRSQRNIVEFNNAFFKNAAANSVDIIKAAYADVEQKVPARKPKAGLVSISLLPNDDYDNRMIAKVKETIEYLLSNNIPQGKIAVIVRKNKHIKLLADYFLHNPVSVNGEQRIINMVSDEAFRLDASLAVNIIINSFKWLINPSDQLTAAFLAKAYRKICLGEQFAEIDSSEHSHILDLLPKELTASRTELLSTPIIDLAEKLYSIFHLERLNDQSAYVCAFFDQLSAYLKKHIAGLDDFLGEWDETICSKSIHSDEIDGIRMLTVHKSKGLEYDNVIIPFCDWDLEDSRDILWVEPHVTPYSDLPVVPLHLQAKRLQESIYKEDYDVEHVQNLVDNLNVLYVAFTRASRNLFVFGKNDGAKYPSQVIKQSLPINSLPLSPSEARSNESLPLAPSEGVGTSNTIRLDGAKVEESSDGSLNFTYGSLCPSKVQPQQSKSIEDVKGINGIASPLSEGEGLGMRSFSEGEGLGVRSSVLSVRSNVFTQPETGITVNIGINNNPGESTGESGKTGLHFLQSNASADFMTPDDELEEKQKRQSYIDTGNVLHALFSTIQTYDDIDKAIDQLEFDGVLYDHPMTRQQLKQYIEKELSIPKVRDWFSPRWKVMNECSILYFDEAQQHVCEQRPDRVIYDGKQVIVIDFKTGKQMERHKAQVRGYMHLLEIMGYTNIHGYLWYIRHNEVVEV